MKALAHAERYSADHNESSVKKCHLPEAYCAAQTARWCVFHHPRCEEGFNGSRSRKTRTHLKLQSVISTSRLICRCLHARRLQPPPPSAPPESMCSPPKRFPEGKVVFLAPTKPLVAQQISACYDIMGLPESDTAELQGSVTPEKRRALWDERRVFYCTPQSMANDIKHKRCDPGRFVCVVVDEVRKAGKMQHMAEFICVHFAEAMLCCPAVSGYRKKQYYCWVKV